MYLPISTSNSRSRSCNFPFPFPFLMFHSETRLSVGILLSRHVLSAGVPSIRTPAGSDVHHSYLPDPGKSYHPPLPLSEVRGCRPLPAPLCPAGRGFPSPVSCLLASPPCHVRPAGVFRGCHGGGRRQTPAHSPPSRTP